MNQQLHKLHELAIAFSSENDFRKLVNLILLEARRFTKAQAGALYISDHNFLVCVAAQNQSLSSPGDLAKFKAGYVGLKIPISEETIVGTAAFTQNTVNVPDLKNPPRGGKISFGPAGENEALYRIQSVLAVPLESSQGKIIGVLELMNPLDSNEKTTRFSDAVEGLMRMLARQASVAIINAKLLGDLKNAHLNTILRLSVAAEYRDDDTAGHLRRISSTSVILANRLGLPAEDIEILKYASPMHDIGKIAIPDAVLLKPGKLTPEEFEEIKKHTLIGAKILEGSDLKLFLMAKEIALTHHERFDGSGYPHGLKGKEIPLMGRIVAIPDVFDALTSKRLYKPSFPLEKSLAIIREESGKHFDPEMVEAFFQSVDEIAENYKQEGLLAR